MLKNIYRDLQWLPSLPADINLPSLNPGTIFGDELNIYAQHSLNNSQLNFLARTLKNVNPTEDNISPLLHFKLGIISNSTTSLLVSSLIATAPRYGLFLDIIESPFNQALSETITPNSNLYAANPDAILFALDYRGLPLPSLSSPDRKSQISISQSLDYLKLIKSNINRHSNAISILQTFASPPERIFGEQSNIFPESLGRQLFEINQFITAQQNQADTLIFDVANLAQIVGLSEWFDPTYWYLGKLPFSQHFLPLYADHCCRLIAAHLGMSKKCLVLDLDNTIWGGTIGDNGLQGIILGQDSGLGEAFIDIQKTALMLKNRGVILAVCSKNEEHLAMQVFSEHPDMILKESDIATFRINWNDKASNINSIAKELNININSLVLLDDNPVERDFVRKNLPHITVPELPDDPSLYSRTLLAGGYFETISYTKEDSSRTNYYKENSERLKSEKQVENYNDYLLSLKMTASFSKFDVINRARITQLINKSNQFNLTTKRYTENQIKEFENSSEYFTMQVRLADKFGDNGIVSIVICKKEKKHWLIDTWLMSCRVLKRRLEEAVLQEIICNAGQEGVEILNGTYVPSKLNMLVEDHYSSLEFDFINEKKKTTTWELKIRSYNKISLPISITHKA